VSKIEQNKERKRNAILKAAQEVFLSEGYTLASMDKIATLAQVTKQTVYRYFPSKLELFSATLQQLGHGSEPDFCAHLQEVDTRTALYGFARGFIRAHLSREHLATFRLLIAESDIAPEIMRSFCEIGPDDTSRQLVAFFVERLGVEDAETTADLWAAMLLSHRSRVLMGMGRPDDQQIDEHAKAATDFLLAAVSTA